MSNTVEDLELSSLSYTDKDFSSLYEDELDIAKKLTNKWDPSHSNESDPGVVLLKEAAFIGDHNNYNIDKNILEAFLPSATQDISARNICEMNGYTPKYYISATGEMKLVWTQKSDDTSLSTFTIPAFTFVLSNSDGSISYTQIENISIAKSGAEAYGKFIEGSLQTLTVNNDETINLNNLDDNNRIYFPESMVAQNGIYVKNINSDDYDDYWERNNYLLTQPSGSHVYKIDYDSEKSLPYIEFPSDISNLIGDGLSIKYISTSGIGGNVSAKEIVEIQSPSTFIDLQGNERSSEDFAVTNTGAISNGKDPETIDEMYQSFKKIVGTFDTLVTCKDYSNAIYTNEEDLVSNCYVTDRRTDYNRALNVVSYDENCSDEVGYFKNISISHCALNLKTDEESCTSIGDMYYNNGVLKIIVDDKGTFKDFTTINLNDFSILTSAMTPYDLVIYSLKAFSANDYSSLNKLNKSKALDNSFTPIKSSSSLSEIEYDLEENKCISHIIKTPNSNEIVYFRNYEPLSIKITPYNKVETTAIRDEIYLNIYKALSNNFNPRHLEFGSNLNLDDVKEVIENSDTRIKSVTVEYLTCETKAIDIENKSYSLSGKLNSGSYTILTDMIAKNILAGRVCLFEFDNDFAYDYGQSDCTLKDSISVVKTEVPIELAAKGNDYISIKKGTVNSVKIESTGSNLSYIFNAPNYLDSNDNRKNLDINATSYTLVGDDFLIINTLDSDGNKVDSVTYKSSETDGKEITITNSLSSGSLKNEDSKTAITIDVGGYIGVKTTIADQSIDEGVTNLDYTLKANEAIQIIYPNYVSEYSYGTYVNYRYEGTYPISANTEHILTSDEQIILIYTQDNITQQKILTNGTIVNCNFDLVPTDNLTSSSTKKTWTNSNGITHESSFKQLSSSQTISTRKLMQTKLSSTNIQCYWIVNPVNSKYTLFESGKYERILGDGEYFIYANSSLDELMILGSGTKLIRTDDDDSKWTMSSSDLTIESISEQGTSLDINWQKMDFSKNPFYITEMSVVTLGEGDNIVIAGWSGLEESGEYINNSFRVCDGSIIITSNGTTTTFAATDDFYQIRSRLDLNVGPEKEQELFISKDSSGNDMAIQKITLGSSTVISAEGKDNCKIQCSTLISTTGEESIDMTQYGTPKFYAYTNIKSGDRAITLDSKKADKAIYPFFYRNSTNYKRTYLIPIYIRGNESPISVRVYKKVDETETDIEFLNYNVTKASTSMTLDGNNLYFISPSNNVTTDDDGIELYLELSWGAVVLTSIETINVLSLKVVEGLNSKIKGAELDDVLGRIKEIIKGSDKPSLTPLYTSVPDNSMVVSNPDFGSSNIMWDKNNVANIMALPYIDLANSSLDISDEMKGYAND